MSKPKLCPICGERGCTAALPTSGWPRVTGMPYEPDFRPYELRLAPDNRKLPPRLVEVRSKGWA